MIKARVAKLIAGTAVPLAALAIGLTAESASATTKNGSWWSSHYDCGSAVDFQLHYINDNADNLTRPDGFGVHLSDRSAAMWGVTIDEYVSNGTKVGSVSIGVASRTDSRTGIGTNYLPWVRPAEKPFVVVTVDLSSGLTDWSANCPVIAFGQ